MRHVVSLLLALALAPVVWVCSSLGAYRNLEALRLYATDDPGFTARLAGGGALMAAAGVAFGVLLATRLSPLGPLLVGLLHLALAAAFVAGPRAFYDALPALSAEGYRTALAAPVEYGWAWLVGMALLVPAVLPSRWRAARPTPRPAGVRPAPAPAPYREDPTDPHAAPVAGGRPAAVPVGAGAPGSGGPSDGRGRLDGRGPLGDRGAPGDGGPFGPRWAADGPDTDRLDRRPRPPGDDPRTDELRTRSNGVRAPIGRPPSVAPPERPARPRLRRDEDGPTGAHGPSGAHATLDPGDRPAGSRPADRIGGPHLRPDAPLGPPPRVDGPSGAHARPDPPPWRDQAGDGRRDAGRDRWNGYGGERRDVPHGERPPPEPPSSSWFARPPVAPSGPDDPGRHVDGSGRPVPARPPG